VDTDSCLAKIQYKTLKKGCKCEYSGDQNSRQARYSNGRFSLEPGIWLTGPFENRTKPRPNHSKTGLICPVFECLSHLAAILFLGVQNPDLKRAGFGMSQKLDRPVFRSPLYSERPNTGPSGFWMVIFWTIFGSVFRMLTKWRTIKKTGQFFPVFKWSC
jgi:hypothetical protein